MRTSTIRITMHILWQRVTSLLLLLLELGDGDGEEDNAPLSSIATRSSNNCWRRWIWVLQLTLLLSISTVLFWDYQNVVWNDEDNLLCCHMFIVRNLIKVIIWHEVMFPYMAVLRQALRACFNKKHYVPVSILRFISMMWYVEEVQARLVSMCCIQILNYMALISI